MLFRLTAIFLYKTGPIQWIFSEHHGTDGMVQEHQGISNNIAEYTSTHFQLFMG